MNAACGLITYALERSFGGIGRYTRELICAFRAMPISLTILQAGRSNSAGRVVNLPGAGLLPGLLTFGQFQVAQVARQNQLELLHDPTGTVPLLLAQTRRVATIHDVFPFFCPKNSTALDWLIYHYWLPIAVRGLDAIITVSEHSKQDILRALPVEADKVIIIPEAASAKYRRLHPGQVQPVLVRAGIDFPYILYVGSIEPRKNLLRMLEAYAEVRKRSQKWNLVIVGARNFWKSSPVKQTIERLDLKSYVHFTGYVAEDELPALYNGASLFVFPSLYEGFGLPVLEAMACGTPVVASKCSSLPEVTGNAALLVDPFKVDEIASAITKMLTDSDLWTEYQWKGLMRATAFSWENTARQTVKVYERLLNP